MHSRNSCKTLKCPRCNWHYKYQETLEIHMKEKHPENELNCLYCLTNQGHPRLARGETYTCGYKPYRCEVCNYSTTTKGNLSIHMTSDKHMTNIQHYDANAVAAASKLVVGQQQQQQQQLSGSTGGTNNSTNAGQQLSGSSDSPANATNITNNSANTGAAGAASGGLSMSQQHQLIAAAAAAAVGSSPGDPEHEAAMAAVMAQLSGQQDSSSMAHQLDDALLHSPASRSPVTATSLGATSAEIARNSSRASSNSSGGASSPSSSRNNSPYGQPNHQLNQQQQQQQVAEQQQQQQQQQNLLQSLQQQQLATSLSNALAMAAASSSSTSSSPTTTQSCNTSGNSLANHQQQQPPTSGSPAMDSAATGSQQQNPAAAAMAAAILLAQQNPNALEDYINSQEIAKDSYDDPSRKYKCHRCKVAFTRQSYLTAHNKTLFHRKGEKLAYPMEKYLDPNRPFKCDICKESFTQKSILLVHNNSVSHLNKQRQTKKAAGQAATEQLHQTLPQPSQQPQTHLQLPVQASKHQQQTQLQQQQQHHIKQDSHHQSAQQQQQLQNPLAALAAAGGDPMAALMAGGANPMAALMFSNAMGSHPMMPFMMNPNLMAAAATLAAAQTSRMLDPMSQNIFGQSSPAVSSTGNLFADFQSQQQQQLMQQAASQLAAVAAVSSAGGNSNQAYSLGNLLNPAAAVELMQQQQHLHHQSASTIAPTAVVNSVVGSQQQQHMGSGNAVASSAVSDSNLVSSTLDSLAHSRQSKKQSSSQMRHQSDQQSSPSNVIESAQAAATAAAAAAAALSVQQQKRARTRISEEQLRILRQYFDINNSPTEEQLLEMSVKSELPLKVIKHWFRNTLFKERQKNKDSPYNFNNPPMLALNLEEYERTGEAKVTPISDLVANNSPDGRLKMESELLDQQNRDNEQQPSQIELDCVNQEEVQHHQGGQQLYHQQHQHHQSFEQQQPAESIEDCAAAVVRDVVQAVVTADEVSAAERSRRLRRSKRVEKRKLSPVSDENAGIGPSSTWSPLQLQQQLFDQTWASVNNHLSAQQGLSSKTSDSSSHSINSSTNSKSKRANRTRFSDRQVKVLQEFFELNAYPKDDDLECLSKQLGLSPRVIVVWFQNARQKARKVYENRPTSASMSEGDDDDQESLHQQSLSSSTTGAANRLASGLISPMWQDDGESSLGGNEQQLLEEENRLILQDEEEDDEDEIDERMQVDDEDDDVNNNLNNGTGVNNSAGDNHHRASHLGMHQSHEEGQECAGDEEEEDEDEFMSAAQMMRHQQQQQRQQQQNQQLAAAAAAAGLFGGDASNLLSLIAANQSAGNLLGSDLHQRNMMEALNSAMRGAVQSANGNLAGGLPASPVLPGGNANGNGMNHSNSGNNNHLNNHSLNLNESSNASLGAVSNMSGGERNTSSSSASQRDKRLRTQISPEQLDYLYQKYQVESNPSRKTLESIAQDVGLSKRVVQVWFQNTRARERRGQLRMSHVVAQQQRSQAASASNTLSGAGATNNSASGISGPKLESQQQQQQQQQQQNGSGSIPNGISNNTLSSSGQVRLKDEAANAANAAAQINQLASLTGSNAAMQQLAALMARGQLLEGTPGFAPLDLSGSKALFAGLNQLGALGVGLNFDTQQR